MKRKRIKPSTHYAEAIYVAFTNTILSDVLYVQVLSMSVI